MVETFPFGKPILKVNQKERSAKKVFILGVYASAVHATWYSPKGKVIVRALAVDSEPEIFWRGDNAADIISKIDVPNECGYLLPADIKFNGPSGRSLDNHFLYPQGLDREDVWLCDLLPKSRMNSGQAEAIKRAYTPLIKSGIVPEINYPEVQYPISNELRRSEIVSEIKESKAKVLILLGDKPIKEFLKYYYPCKNLAQLCKDGKEYGETFTVSIDDYKVEVLPLVHPRQAGKLGKSSKSWGDIHNKWIQRNLAIQL